MHHQYIYGIHYVKKHKIQDILPHFGITTVKQEYAWASPLNERAAMWYVPLKYNKGREEFLC